MRTMLIDTFTLEFAVLRPRPRPRCTCDFSLSCAPLHTDPRPRPHRPTSVTTQFQLALSHSTNRSDFFLFLKHSPPCITWIPISPGPLGGGPAHRRQCERITECIAEDYAETAIVPLSLKPRMFAATNKVVDDTMTWAATEKAPPWRNHKPPFPD